MHRDIDILLLLGVVYALFSPDNIQAILDLLDYRLLGYISLAVLVVSVCVAISVTC